MTNTGQGGSCTVRVAIVADLPWRPRSAALTVTGPVGWDARTLERELGRLGPLQLRGRVRPTAGLGLVAAAVGLLQVLSRATGSAWLALTSTAVLALPVVAVLLRPRLNELRVERLLHGRGAVGEKVSTTLVLTNDGRLRSPALLAYDRMPGHADVQVEVPPLRPGGVASALVTREVLARTASLGGRIRLTAGSPVGLLTVRRDVPLLGDVRARPAPAPLRRLRPPAGAGTGGLRRPQPGDGTELLGLREWRVGDGRRAVSARASARHGRPMVHERERDVDPQLVVLLSAAAPGSPLERREAAISSAAALATAAARSGTPVVVLGPPGPTRPRPDQLVDAFAAADLAPPLSGPVLARALTFGGRGGRLLLVAPSPELADAARRDAAALGCDLVVLDA